MDVHIDFRRTLSPTEYGPHAFLACYDGSIVRSEDNRKVGRARSLVAEIERAREHGYGALEFLDVDGSSWPYHELLSQREAGSFTPAVNHALGIDEVYGQNLLIIDRIEVLPRYRGKDYGLQAMHLMLTHLSLGCRLAAIKPYPLQFEGDRPLGESVAWRRRLNLESFTRQKAAATQRLRQHYGRLGFVPVKGTPLMVLDVDDGYLKQWNDVAGELRT
jgi:GNAT superfamily N-acetyltransferase